MKCARRVVLARPWALARTVLRRAMLGYYGSIAERVAAHALSLDQQEHFGESPAGLPYVFVSDDYTAHYHNREQSSDSHQRQTDLLELHDYLDALEQSCGRTARLIAQNLMEPVGECAARLLVEARRKQVLQRRGYSPSHPRVRFSQRAVREAMALDKRAWADGLEQVRGFTRVWIDKTA